MQRVHPHSIFLLKKDWYALLSLFSRCLWPESRRILKKETVLQTYAIRLLQPRSKVFFFFWSVHIWQQRHVFVGFVCRLTTQNLASLPTGGENSFPSADLFSACLFVCLIFTLLFASPHCPLMTSPLTPENVPKHEGGKSTTFFSLTSPAFFSFLFRAVTRKKKKKRDEGHPEIWRQPKVLFEVVVYTVSFPHTFSLPLSLSLARSSTFSRRA